MKRVNPRRKPASVADVQAAYKLGRKESIEFAIAVSCLACKDVFHPDQEKMQEFHDKYCANVDAIINRTIKYEDVLEVLKDEYELELEFK